MPLPPSQALGRHLIAEFYQCPANKLNDVVAIEESMVAAAQQAKATVINSTFHHFAPMGVSGVVVIQESHLAIHTWPEYGFAAVDLFTCGDTVSPWIAMEVLKEKLGAEHVSAIEMRRGQPELLPPPMHAQPYDEEASPPRTTRKRTKELWFTERAGEIALSVKHEGELLEQRKSTLQRIEVLRTPALGDILVLDGIMAATTLDGGAVHEMLVHPALLCHHNPANVIVIGGGDGGAVSEILKHQEVLTVNILEQDQEVMEVAKKWLPQWAQALQHRKVTCTIGDARQSLVNIPPETADVILVDAYNPAQMEDGKWDASFFRQAYELLTAEGIAVFQIGSPWINQAEFKAKVQQLHQLFGKQHVFLYQASLPSYPTGYWIFALATKKKIIPMYDHEHKIKNFLNSYKLNYINISLYKGMWALPNFVINLTQH